jgi:hypothetical protein
MIKARPCPGEGRYVLLEDYVIAPGWITIPKGYKWDGASIHRFLWPFAGSPFTPKFMRASLVHDYLYYRMDVSGECNDLLFRSILLEDGVGKKLAYTMYYAVRVYRVFRRIFGR